MKAGFEKRAFADTADISAVKYKNLHNLPHWHMEYELVFVLNGSAELMINNSFYKIREGVCAFIASEEIHYIKADAESVLGIIKTDAASVKKIAANKHLVTPVLSENSYGTQVFFDIFSELKNKKEFHNIIADAIITKFIAEIFRNEPSSSYTEPTKRINKKYKELIGMLSTNYANITFEEAAGYMGLNKSYFSRCFYRFAGMTFTRYLNILKVSAAIEKINQGKSNMTEISISCGFGTIRNLNRVFKELTGYAPKKLPANYIFAYMYKESGDNEFDPTLNCTEIIE